MAKTILITGCSTGLGFAAARAFAERGYRVIATVRSEADARRVEGQQEGSIQAVLCDVTVEEQVAELPDAIRRITGDKELIVLDEQMRPVTDPELPELARALPADTAYQITRTAERLGFTDYSDVLAEVANAVTRKAVRPKAIRRDTAPRLADASFPHKTPVTQCRDEPQRYSSSGQAPARSRRERSSYYLPKHFYQLGQGLPSVITPPAQCKTVRAERRIRSPPRELHRSMRLDADYPVMRAPPGMAIGY